MPNLPLPHDRTTATHFLDKIKLRPYDFDLFFALRVLQAKHPQLPRLGTAMRPSAEPIRLGQDPSLIFAPATIAEVLPGKDHVPDRLTVWSFGLYGPNGPMPTHITEYVRDRLRQYDDATIARFSDIFHHRLLLLFFRAWSDAQPCNSLDRPLEDAFGRFLASIVGIGEKSQRHRDHVPDQGKLFLAGHLTRWTRNPEGLERAIAAYFRITVVLQEYCVHYLPLEPEQQTCLVRYGGNTQLGLDTILGARVPDAQYKFRLRIGPLSLSQYERFLPGGESFMALVDWVRNYVGIEYVWDFVLVLKQTEIPGLSLGGESRIGLTTWFSQGQERHDPDDYGLDAEAYLQQRIPVH